jgi:hypothetical protein
VDAPGAPADAGPDALDTSPPKTTSTSKPSAISGPNVVVAFESTEPGTFECSLDGAAFAPCTTPAGYDGLAATPNPHVFEVRARDDSGNVDASPAHFEWQVDPNALDTTLTKLPPSTSGRNVSFEFTSTRPGTFECKLSPEESSFSACTSPKGYANLQDASGPHTFAVRAIDTASNVGDSPATYQWTVDSTGPTVSITSPGSRSGARPLLAFNTETGATYSCRFDDAAAFACTTESSSPTTLSAGGHVLYVRGTDAVGNEGLEAAKGFTVDTTRPTFSSFDGPSAGGTSTRTATFIYAAADDSGVPPTITCALDGHDAVGRLLLPEDVYRPRLRSTNNRVVAFSPAPTLNGAAAAAVVGQDDFTHVDMTAAPDQKYFTQVGTVCVAGSKLLVSDPVWHRVLEFELALQ